MKAFRLNKKVFFILLIAMNLFYSTIATDEPSTAEPGTETTAEAGTETTAEAGTETTAEAGTETTAEAGTETTAEAGTEKSTKPPNSGNIFSSEYNMIIVMASTFLYKFIL
jgi:uncharacterized protein YabE (DUF348 family)